MTLISWHKNNLEISLKENLVENGLGLDPDPNQLDPDQNPKRNQFVFGFRILFYTFWYRNQQMFKITETQKIFGSKIFKKIFVRSFKFVTNFRPKNCLSLKNFKHLLISTPKCKELNSQFKLVSDYQRKKFQNL